MSYRSLILFAFCAVAAPVCAESQAAQNSQTMSVEQKIERLKVARQRLQLEAELAGQKADQVMTQDWMGYQEAIHKQQRCQERIKAIDAEIQQLEQQEKK